MSNSPSPPASEDDKKTILPGRGNASGSSSPTVRTIIVDGSVSAASPQTGFKNNSISTTKYNAFSFVPKFLFEQFQKYANIFFLFISCIQQVDGVSPTNKFTTVGPLSVVLFLSALKELFEDYKRRVQDHVVNNRETRVLENGKFVSKKWKDVLVGDIVRVENFQFFPADLVLLSSSEPDALCYIETANLDGETNLKIRQGRPETSDLVSPEQVSLLKGVMKTEVPNNSLYTFEGTFRINDSKDVPLDPNQILLRGAQLRNTRWVYGAVIFTGHDSKLLKNATPTPIKKTSMENTTNTQILFLFLMLLVLALISSICNNSFNSNTFKDHNYLNPLNPNPFGLQILTFIILYNNLIPISLIVTMEISRLILAFLISCDLDMYHAETDNPAVVRTSSLVEELGQVEFIFSDKTGTLTCNKMELKQCMIAGRNYVEKRTEGQLKAFPDRVDENGFEVGAYEFPDIVANLDRHSTKDTIDEYMTLLAVCHTVIPETSDHGEITYQASSPDEAALVKGAASMGYRFTVRRPRSVTIQVLGQSKEYEILNVCEFNSTRKRMSVISRHPDGTIVLYCKGADTVIYERLKKDGNPFSDKTLEILEECATEGLRTLCLARRVIPESEYVEWNKQYLAAANTINNRSAELDRVAELIEKDLFLLGATAIEDKLQDGVPDTIAILARAGIRIWVLTGDRQETAINIGFSCKLLTEEMTLIIINEQTHFEAKAAIESKLEAVKNTLKASNQEENDGAEIFALIIDGKTLDFALEKDVKNLFFELGSLCKAVICCRVSPLQKALVVKLAKTSTKSTTLAIVYGANDVSMIQAAHIGVGISGEEGLQAARSADFAISQFRYLKKLLLVHGGWSNRRQARLILFSFYKNIALYLTQFWFAFSNGFTGTTLYESWVLTAYNVFFTIFPPFILGIFNQHIGVRSLDNYPELYAYGQKMVFFNSKVFWSWAGNAIMHSGIIYGLMMVFYGTEMIDSSNGTTTGLYFWGLISYTCVLMTVLGKASLIIEYWNKYSFIGIFGSVGLYVLFLAVYCNVRLGIGYEVAYYFVPLFSSSRFWLALIFIPVVTLLRDISWKYYKRTYQPESYNILQELQKYNIPDYRPRMDKFKKAVHKVRQLQRMKRNRGFAFSQNETGEADLIRQYDTTKAKPKG